MVSFNIPSLLSGSSSGTLLSSDKTNCKLDKDNEEFPSFLYKETGELPPDKIME
jgi:hypothetical protein